MAGKVNEHFCFLIDTCSEYGIPQQAQHFYFTGLSQCINIYVQQYYCSIQDHFMVTHCKNGCSSVTALTACSVRLFSCFVIVLVVFCLFCFCLLVCFFLIYSTLLLKNRSRLRLKLLSTEQRRQEKMILRTGETQEQIVEKMVGK